LHETRDVAVAIGYSRAIAADYCGQAVEYLNLFLKIAIFWPRVQHGYLHNSKTIAIKEGKVAPVLN
jgi:hypothetical protein